MSEQQKAQRGGFAKSASKAPGASDLPSISDVPNVAGSVEKIEGKVKVIHGANDEEFELVGQTIGAIRSQLVDSFNIPADAMALIDGEQVNETTVVKAGVTVEFIKQAGVKGFSL